MALARFRGLGREVVRRSQGQGKRAFPPRDRRGVGWTVGDKQSRQKCDPYEQGGKPLGGEEAEKLLETVDGWRLCEESKHIVKSFSFVDSSSALAFLPLITNISINGNHVPVEIQCCLTTASPCVELKLSTPALEGLSYNDFMLALKLDNALIAYATTTPTKHT
eukprot:CAMPEP_0197526672 /NCGR_PEP_ID=MMETSP1318-20131121/18786_1 /TAXON_ID=552666 /ORGANISM="Partenskyella glossopodia, Strain RCC365" /LENGTH=163 /DNA_ID=CAMNT_0043080949 /DNA_START=9 /DNA_END=500 /DNA_ORIENTATION=+